MICLSRRPSDTRRAPVSRSAPGVRGTVFSRDPSAAVRRPTHKSCPCPRLSSRKPTEDQRKFSGYRCCFLLRVGGCRVVSSQFYKSLLDTIKYVYAYRKIIYSFSLSILLNLTSLSLIHQFPSRLEVFHQA